jgi:hypothetical protein
MPHRRRNHRHRRANSPVATGLRPQRGQLSPGRRDLSMLGVRIRALMFPCGPAGRRSRSSPAENEQRATMQTPQGLDATHGGELFPIDARASWQATHSGESFPSPEGGGCTAPTRMLPSELLAMQETGRGRILLPATVPLCTGLSKRAVAQAGGALSVEVSNLGG